MRQKLTKQNVYKYWGDAIENLVKSAWDIINSKGEFYIDSKVRGTTVPIMGIKGLRLGMVSYRGDGKYDNSRFWFWDDVPDWDGQSLNDSDDEELLDPPAGQGWWPVIAIDLLPQFMGYKATGTVLVVIISR